MSFLFLLATALVVSPAAAVVILAAAILLLLALQPLAHRSRASTLRHTHSRAAWAQELVQDQTLCHEIAVFGIADWVQRSSHQLLAAVRRDHEATIRLSSLAPVLYQSATYLIAGLLLLFFSVSGVRPRGFAAVVLLLVRGLYYSQNLQLYLHAVEERSGAFERVEAITTALRAAAVASGSVRDLEWNTLEFEDVWLSYEPGRPAITGVSFRAERGEKRGIQLLGVKPGSIWGPNRPFSEPTGFGLRPWEGRPSSDTSCPRKSSTRSLSSPLMRRAAWPERWSTWAGAWRCSARGQKLSSDERT